MNLRFLAPAILAMLALSGCAFNSGYNPAYLPSAPMAPGIPGKALVVIDEAEQQRVFSSKPTSFTGTATTLTIPLGEITKQVALRVFGGAFVEGADFRGTVESTQGYRLVIKPKVTNLTYAYNQLKNLGFAITPQVEMDLEVVLIDAEGRPVSTQVHRSGLVNGESYALSGQPGEKVNRLIHLTLHRLMTEAAQDAKSRLGTPGRTAGSG